MTSAGLENTNCKWSFIASDRDKYPERNFKPLHIEFRSWLKQSDSGLESSRYWEGCRGSAELQSCRCSRTAPDLHVPLLEISAMAYFPINTTSHSESLRHGFSTRIHSQTRWRLKNNTHKLAGDILHESGTETGERNRFQSLSRDPQSSDSYCTFASAHRTRGPWSTWAVTMATPSGRPALTEGTFYTSGMWEIK